MPRIYTAKCGHCGYTDMASEDAVELQNDDGTLTPLPHPGEHRSLEEAGYTWERAEDEARLVTVRTFLCRRCGGFREWRHFGDATRCRTMSLYFIALAFLFAAAIAVGTAFIRVGGHRGSWSPVALLLGMALLAWLAGRVLWRRDNRRFCANLPKRPPLDDRPCCDAEELLALELAEGRRDLACPQCGGKSVEVVNDWIS